MLADKTWTAYLWAAVRQELQPADEAVGSRLLGLQYQMAVTQQASLNWLWQPLP